MVGLVRGRIMEAVRLARKSPSKDVKVLAYYWFKFQDQHDDFVESVSIFYTIFLSNQHTHIINLEYK